MRRATLAFLGLATLVFVIQAVVRRGMFEYFAVDYRVWFAAASQVAQWDFQRLYLPEHMRLLEAPLDAYGPDRRYFSVLPFVYLPVFALPMLPCACLPPVPGCLLWIAGNVLLVGWSLRRLCRALGLSWQWWALSLLSLPMVLNFFYAQVSGWLVVASAELILAWRAGRKERAGWLLAFFALKPQFLLTFGWGLVVRREKRLLSRFFLGIGLCLLASLALAGPTGMAALGRLLSDYRSDYGNFPEGMINWRMVAVWLWSDWASPEAIWPTGVGIAFCWLGNLLLWRRRQRPDCLLFLGSACASLAVSWHCQPHTASLLLPFMLWALAEGEWPEPAFLAFLVLPPLFFVSAECLVPEASYSHFLNAWMGLGINLAIFVWVLGAHRWHPGPRVLAFGAGAVLLGGAALQNIPQVTPGFFEFGWEYGNISQCLVKTGVFGDSMGPDSGPTAWMPPLLSWFYAALFSLVGIRSPLAAWLAILTDVALLALATLLLAHMLRGVVRPLGLVLALLWFGWMDATAWLADLHDVPLLASLNVAAVATLYALMQGRFPRFGPLVALLAPLASPVVSAAFMFVLVMLFLKRQLPGRHLLLLSFCLLLSGGAWTVRNRLVFGHYFWIKPNMLYDFCQANLMDDDGIPTSTTFLRCHPCNQNAARTQYYSLGEARFLEIYREQAALVGGRELLVKVGHRAWNALGFVLSGQDIEVADPPLPLNDATQLEMRGLLYDFHGYQLWTSLTLSPAEMLQRLRALPLRHPTLAMLSWSTCRDLQTRRQSSLQNHLWGYSHGLLPCLALLLACLLPPLRGHPLPGLLLLYSGLILTPYILVSHYERYQLSLSGLAVMSLALGLEACLATASSWASRRRRYDTHTG